MSFAPAGQQVLPGQPAQLGFDGGAYAPVEVQSEPAGGVAPPPAPAGGLTLPLDTPDQPSLPVRAPGRSGAVACAAAPGSPPARGTTVPGSLGSNTVNVAARPIRAKMWRIREGLRGRHGLPRSTTGPSRTDRCGRVRIGGDVQVWQRDDGDGPRANFRGLVRCGCVWACACCGLAIRAARAEFVGELVSRHVAETGGPAYLLTFTVRHGMGDDPNTVIRGVNRAVRRLRMRRGWRRMMDRLGVLGDVRVLEMTHGPNGWHPHAHFVVCAWAPVEPGLLAEIEKGLAEQWRQAVISELGWEHAPDLFYGTDLRAASSESVASYIAKLGLEVVDPAGKTAKRGNRTPLGIAEQAARGDAQSLALWREFVSATRGLKFMTWSGRGGGPQDLRERYGMHEKEDQEIVDGEHQGAVLIGLVPALVWDSWARDDALAILEAAERDPSTLDSLSRAMAAA